MTEQKKKVLITGASGLIGGLTLNNLGDKYEFSALNRRAIDGIPCVQADIADADAIQPAFEGIDTVLHLSAYTEDVYEWDGTERVNIRGTYNVFEAARTHGVKRVVFASSGGTMLGYEKEEPYGTIFAADYDSIPDTWPLLTHLDPVRPNTLCYVSKIFGEVMGRMYSDQHDISVLVIRFGAVLPDDVPEMRRHYPGYLSQADAVQMIDKCLSAPDSIKNDIFEAITNNKYTRRYLNHTKKK